MTISTFGLRIFAAVGLVTATMLAVPAAQQGPSSKPDPNAAPPGASLSTGPASNVMPISLAPKCTHEPTSMKIEPDVFPVSTGVSTSTDGKKWVVPGPVQDDAPL